MSWVKRPLVFKVPAWIFSVVERLRPHQTVLQKGFQVLPHAHRYVAVYFVKHVRLLSLASGRQQLPQYAIVAIPPGVIHGWFDVRDEAVYGMVEHFHPGHGAHEIERE